MRRNPRLTFLGALLVLAGCTTHRPPVVAPPPPPPANQTLAIDLEDAGTHAALSGHVAMDEVTGPIERDTDGTGHVEFSLAPGPRGFLACATGYACQRVDGVDNSLLDGGATVRRMVVGLDLDGVEPGTFTLEEIAAVRGAMWPSSLALPYGPRPGAPDNILAMGYYGVFSAEDRARMLTQYHDVDGYTHAVTGPIQGNDCYHGKYPCWRGDVPSQAQWDAYLDELQVWWNHGIVPIYFAHPDGWSFERTRDVMTPLLQQPRAQRLIRFIVPAGWEPAKYEWSSCTWAKFGQWARETLPNAVVALHTVSDIDAPVGGDALCNDDDRSWNPQGNAGGWARVAPFFHVWLVQNGPYRTSPQDDPTTARNFCAQFQSDGVGAEVHSIAWHFKGPGGWTRSSAWGTDRPIWLIAAEHTAYNAFWGSLAEPARKEWGDLARRCGADGYLDGGTLPVR